MKCSNIKKVSIALLAVMLMLLSGQTIFAADAVLMLHKELPRSGKTTAPISISYSVPAHVAVGDAVQVTVTIKALSDVADFNVKLNAGDGLEMSSGEYLKNYGNQVRNSEFSETVTVIPNTEGILYLNVFATGTFNGKKMTSAGAVPVNTGTAPRKMLKKSGHTTTDSKGQKLIIMPVEEAKPHP
jgi:hypothetical protein